MERHGVDNRREKARNSGSFFFITLCILKVIGAFQQGQLTVDFRVACSGFKLLLCVRLNICGCDLMCTSPSEIGKDVFIDLDPYPLQGAFAVRDIVIQQPFNQFIHRYALYGWAKIPALGHLTQADLQPLAGFCLVFGLGRFTDLTLSLARPFVRIPTVARLA
jgi:hypothetical protein